MLVKKKCSICGYEYQHETEMRVNIFLQPVGEGAQYYFDLWHFNIEHCPNCGYASRDVESTQNKLIIEDPKYQSVPEIDIVADLNNARPNRIATYLKAGLYYASIGDILNSLKCKLQAGDLVYSEMLYWKEYILDSATSYGAVQARSQINAFKKFADSLIASGITSLENLCENDKTNIDNRILLAGLYSDGDKIQKIKCNKLLNELKGDKLTGGQIKAIEYLLGDLN
jgi:rubredoxin